MSTVWPIIALPLQKILLYTPTSHIPSPLIILNYSALTRGHISTFRIGSSNEHQYREHPSVPPSPQPRVIDVEASRALHPCHVYLTMKLTSWQTLYDERSLGCHWGSIHCLQTSYRQRHFVAPNGMSVPEPWAVKCLGRGSNTGKPDI